ncbi:MAG: hypothetical protein R6V54_10945 [Desulfobacteraceae bacterium]
MVQEKTGVSGTAALDLRGRQSVRATFKLSQRAIEALSLVAVHLGIKQKSLFDHLIEDVSALGKVADEVRMRQFNKIHRVQKTYVLSRKTLDALELISKDHGTPRDALVEYSIKRLESLILAEKSKHEKRKALFDEVIHHFEEGNILLDRSKMALGSDDPLCIHIEKAMSACAKTKADMAVFMEKSKVIEEF